LSLKILGSLFAGFDSEDKYMVTVRYIKS